MLSVTVTETKQWDLWNALRMMLKMWLQRLSSGSRLLTLSRPGHRGRSRGGLRYSEKTGWGRGASPPLAEFWPINCILHLSPSQKQNAVRQRRKKEEEKKSYFPPPSRHGSCFSVRDWRLSTCSEISRPAVRKQERNDRWAAEAEGIQSD